MLRLRRSRLFLIIAALCTALIYHFNSQHSFDDVSYAQVEQVRHRLTERVRSVSGRITHPRLSHQKPLGGDHPSQTSLEVQPSSKSVPAQQSPKAALPFVESSTSASPVSSSIAPVHWSPLPEHFPVAVNEIIELPTGRPKPIPKIQYDFPKKGAHGADSEKQQAIVKTFQFAWKGYQEKAWGKDELRPESGRSRDRFSGWGATLVDTLDTLWIMGMKAEFKQAVAAVANIDFTTSTEAQILVFETTIRYLGGLLGAYDISDQAYPALLTKAVELADVLMASFDTPNRMPQLKYAWKPAFASQPHRADTKSVLAELGSLSLEFTRLAQLTKNAKYYDAIARITNELGQFQNNTDFPGLWPLKVDASGCRKLEKSKPAEVPNEASVNSEQVSFSQNKQALNNNQAGVSQTTNPQRRQFKKRALKAEDERHLQVSTFDDDCEPQGLARRPHEFMNDYGLGSSADSTYEYLVKEHILLAGVESQYRSMYEAAVQTAINKLLFRPMIPDPDRHILQLATLRYIDNGNDRRTVFRPEGGHLLCFAGGMFAVGAKVFERSEDLNIAKKLTDGCVWAGEATPTGIMPEGFFMLPCAEQRSCPWKQDEWDKSAETFYTTDDKSSPNDDRIHGQRVPSDETSENKPATPASTTSRVSRRDIIKSWLWPDKTPSVAEKSTSALEGPQSGLEKRQLGQVGDRLSETSSTDPKSPEQAAHYQADTQTQRWQEPEGHGTQNLTQLHQEKNKEGAPWRDEVTTTSSLAAKATSKSTTDGGALLKKLPPKGMTKITGQKYLLRPEAIESVFIMYRTTGDAYWRTKGWKMFQAIEKQTKVAYGASAIVDVFVDPARPLDEMESFWLAETLKYFYLLFSDPSLVDLDEYVLNTEAHPFKRPV